MLLQHSFRVGRWPLTLALATFAACADGAGRAHHSIGVPT